MTGIHHVTAIAADPRQNLHFYTAALGLRLVKLTVNYDDPGTRHFYYGDSLGRPGTLLTFFAWPQAGQGRHGNGQAAAVAFAVAEGTLPYWVTRLAEHGVTLGEPSLRFGEQVLPFRDPDCLRLELVATPRVPASAGRGIQSIHHVTLSEEGYERTASLLADTMGFRPAGSEGSRFRYAAGSEEPAALIDVLCAPDAPPGRVAAGTVHHVAFRTPDDAGQATFREQIAALGFNVTPVLDRTYFRSIYFREPGGVLFEIATDVPGMTVDEAPEALGSRLVLPAWLEPQRARIEAALPPVPLPAPAVF